MDWDNFSRSQTTAALADPPMTTASNSSYGRPNDRPSGGTIEAILFDIGGVLVTLDGVPSLARLLDCEPLHETIHALWMTSPAVVAHETGRVSATDFAAGVVADLNLPTDASAFLQDFCDWPKGLQPGALELLDAIPRTYRVAALSNTSMEHWERIAPLGLAIRFERAYLSHVTGFLKPDAAAYRCALDDLELPPDAVLFIDDSRTNVAAALALGLHAELARDPSEARDSLVRHGVLKAY